MLFALNADIITMKRLVHIAVLVFLFVGLLNPGPGLAAAPRVALVIGNSAYRDTPLANPVNDARLMAETLRGLGFEVNELTDADQKAMKIAILDFGDRLEEAGQDAVGLFYYAGHGVQVGDQNFLIPLGSAIRREKDVAVEAVSAGWVLGQMEFAGNRMNFVILDACRNNPLTRSFRSATRGLARMNAPRGSLVAYSTGPGEVAADGTGANSPYTLALSQAMRRPNVAAEKMFKLVRDSVMTATKGDQTPWEESSLTGADFYFSVDVSVTVEAPGTAATSDTAATTQQESLFWQSIKDSTDPAVFEEYLRQYPDGRFAGLANIRLDRLRVSAELVLADQAREVGDGSTDAVQDEQVALATGGSVDQEGDNDNPWQTANEIRALLIGNGAKLKGTDDDGTRWREEYKKDGTIHGRSRNWKYTGKWWFEGDMMCFDYDDGDEQDGCWYLAIDSDSTKLWDANGETDDDDNKITYVAP